MRIRDLIDLVESIDHHDRTYYHVTLAENLRSIMERGLTPTVGERSKQLGEGSAVFLFPDIPHAEDAVSGWLGDQFEEEVELALIEVTLPDGVEVHQTDGIDWECWVKDVIPPQHLRIVKSNF